MNPSPSKIRWRCSTGLLAGASLAALAGTVTLNFNTDPSASGLIITTDQSEWRADGGASGANGDGYLSITDARGSQRGGILFKDLEPGLVVKAFTFECDLRIGGGTAQPADGFSLNYARSTDPIISNIENLNQATPYTGTDNEPGTGEDSDAGDGTGGGLPEEGVSTGLAIGFDTWQSATINGVQDVVGISVRVDARLIAQFPVPLKPGNVFLPTMPNPGAQGNLYEYNEAPYRNLPKTDPNYNSSMQTGALSDEDLNGDGVVNGADAGTAQPQFGDPTWGLWIKNLGWEKFRAELTEDAKVKIFWKGVELTPAGGLAVSFSPSPGRIVFAGRTGGAWEVHHVDNITLTTIPADKIIIGQATGHPVGFRVLITDSGPAVLDPNTVTLKLDGVDVPVLENSKTGINTTVGWYDVTRPLTPGSVHKVLVTARDTRGIQESKEVEFTVPSYVTLGPELAVSDVNTAQRGFNVRVHQTALRAQPNSVARAEQQLQGMRGANVADQTGFTGGVYTETDVINYSQVNASGAQEQNGVFQENNGWPDEPIPGIPSATEVNPDSSPYTDNIAAEITTYLHFPQAGVYQLIFNSDDGFRTTAFSGVNEVLTSTIVGQFDGGRGASDTVSTIYVPQAGYYPVRTVWFEGGGGANLEWSGLQMVPTQTSRQLLNSSAADSIKAYRARASAGPAVVSFVHPFRASGNPYLPTTDLIAKIQDGDTAVDQGSIKLYLDGTEVAVTKSKTGNTTTVTHSPAGFLSAGTHTLKVTFSAGSQNYEGSTDFTIAELPVVPPSLALPAGAVNTANRGFLVKTVQNASYTDLGTRGNDTYAAESQINGLLGLPNTADLSSFTGPQGRYVETDVINYYSTGDVGYFTDGNGYPNLPVPGIPGIDPRGSGAFPDATDFPDGGTDSYSQEILTVLDLPAGLVAMNVASDDGFRLTIGNPNEWWTLPVVVGEFSGGRGAGTALDSGTTFIFYVQQAGLYPARLVWYEGGGGSSCEWSSRMPVDENTGQPNHNNATLINDSLVATAIKAYQYPFPNPNVPWVKSFAPGRDYTSSASQARAGADATVSAVIVEGTANIDPASVQLTVDGNPVTPTVTKAGGELKITYTPTSPWADGLHPVVLTFGDRTVSWSFRTTSAMKTPTFFIEAEDFDNNGAGLAEASQMPYAGGAYAGLKAIAGTDYQRDDSASSPLYRHGVNPRVSMDRTGDRTRGVGDIKVNFKLGWIGGGQWYNYTRDLPAGKYNVYAAISHGESNPGQLAATLQKVTGGTVTDLGVFNAPGTGGWGNNALVPLKTAPDGNLVELELGGPTTLRYAASSGDWDFMLLVPAETVVTPPQFTGIRLNPDRTITIEWTGGGTLQAAPTVTGPWVDVTGATSPFTFTPTEQMQFGRIRR